MNKSILSLFETFPTLRLNGQCNRHFWILLTKDEKQLIIHDTVVFFYFLNIYFITEHVFESHSFTKFSDNYFALETGVVLKYFGVL